MFTGTRLTQLNHGEPLLGTVWSYKNLSGVAAAEQRLEDLFLAAKNLGLNSIIDTIRPQLDPLGNLTLENNGFYGDLWPLERRLELYRQFSSYYGMKLIIEVEMPTNVTDTNFQSYSNYIISLITQNSWILNWNILTTPEVKDNFNNIKCSPKNYVQMMKNIYVNVKLNNSNISIGGPGIFQALIDYNNGIVNWLSEAIGDYYDSNDPDSVIIGQYGFLPYVDFFSIQGKQNTTGLSYELFPSIVDKLNTLIQSKLNKTLPIYSIYQGWQASAANGQSLNEQGYYELREILSCIKKGVVPYKNQLVDEYDNGNFSADVLNYGLFYYYLGSNGAKPAVAQYQFLLQSLKDFNTVTTTLEVIDPNPNIDTLTLLNKNGTQSATIVWTKTINDETIILQPHYNRTYLLPDGTTDLIISPIQINLNNYKFVLVFQNINQSTINTVEIEALVEKKINHAEETLTNLINLLPSSYNKEVKDVNYYKLLRAFALEMADAKVEIEKNFDNFYLDTAHEEAIYNNFGILVKLGKKTRWSYEKYKSLVKGITKSLLMGPTTESIIAAVELFTNFNVNIYELYKNPTSVDPNILQNTNPQFTFILEIEKPIDAVVNQDDLYEDVNYVINIVKPAHTLQIVIVSLFGQENYKNHYKDKYGINWKDSDVLDTEWNATEREGIYGYKCIDYDGQFITNNSLTNGGLFVGPRYVLYDENIINVDVNLNEEYLIDVEDTFYSLVQKYYLEDKYESPIDNSALELDGTFREYKFGVNFEGCLIQTNINTFLNQHKLAPSYRLSDAYDMDASMFLQEKYTFRNTLNTLRFNNPSNIPFNGFNSKFAPNIPDKMVEMGEYLTDDATGLKEDIVDEINQWGVESGELYDKGLILEVPEFGVEDRDYSHFGNFYCFLLGGNNLPVNLLNDDIYINPNSDDTYIASVLNQNSLYILSRDHTDIGVDISEQYRDVLDVIENFNINVIEYEYLRERLLGPDILHIHKATHSVINNSLEVFLPQSDLTNKSTINTPSSIRVFVNGLLQSSDVYDEIISPLNSDKIIGVEFHNNTVINGDLITILYVKNQEVIISDFPWEDNYNMDFTIPADEYNLPIIDTYEHYWEKYHELMDTYNLPVVDAINEFNVDAILSETINNIFDAVFMDLGNKTLNDEVIKVITDLLQPEYISFDNYVFPVIDSISEFNTEVDNIENYIPKSDTYSELLSYVETEDIVNMNTISDVIDDMYFELYRGIEYGLIETVSDPTELIEFNSEFNGVEEYNVTNIVNENSTDNTENRILQNNFNNALKFNFMFNSGKFASCNVLDVNSFEFELRENYIQIVEVIKDIDISFNSVESWNEISEEFKMEEDYDNIENYENISEESNKDFQDRMAENYAVKQTQVNMELYKIQGGNKIVIKTN